jgi:hypothetical protein
MLCVCQTEELCDSLFADIKKGTDFQVHYIIYIYIYIVYIDIDSILYI